MIVGQTSWSVSELEYVPFIEKIGYKEPNPIDAKFEAPKTDESKSAKTRRVEMHDYLSIIEAVHHKTLNTKHQSSIE